MKKNIKMYNGFICFAFFIIHVLKYFKNDRKKLAKTKFQRQSFYIIKRILVNLN